MFSRCGKYSKHKFQILLSKDELLNEGRSRSHKKIVLKQDASPDSKFSERYASVEPLKRKAKPDFMFLSKGRDDIIFPVYDSPPPGHYNCNYSLVQKSSSVFKFKKETVDKIRRNLTPSTNINPPSQVNSYRNIAQCNKIPSVPFKKQLPRKDIFIQELNENRFLAFESLPSISTKSKKVNVPDFKKFSRRRSLIKMPKFLNSYHANYSFVKEDLGKVLDFKKSSPRKPLFQGKEDLRNYSVNWSSIDKKPLFTPNEKKVSKLKKAIKIA